MTEVRRYRKRPVEIEAIEMTQYGDFVRAVKWINENGGNASFAEASRANDHQDYLIITTIDGNNAEVHVGWFVVRGVQGEFYPCRGDIFLASHEIVPGPPVANSMTGTGMYVRGAPDGRTALVGGVALPLPT